MMRALGRLGGPRTGEARRAKKWNNRREPLKLCHVAATQPLPPRRRAQVRLHDDTRVACDNRFVARHWRWRSGRLARTGSRKLSLRTVCRYRKLLENSFVLSFQYGHLFLHPASISVPHFSIYASKIAHNITSLHFLCRSGTRRRGTI